MSRITRKLMSTVGGKVVDGPSGGGGIILKPDKPEKPSAECPACVSGGCVPDNYQAMWYYSNYYYPDGRYTDSDLSYNDDYVQPPENGPLVAMIVNPDIISPGGGRVTNTCCGYIDWHFTKDGGEDTELYVANGIVIVFVSIHQVTLTATPTVCGKTLNTLTYVFEGD